MSVKNNTYRWELLRRIGSGYPTTIKILLTLLLFALPWGVWSDAAATAQPLPLERTAILVGLDVLVLLLVHTVPMRKLRMWQQLCVLALQCGLISGMQIAVPSIASGYLFLVPMIQTVYLFGAWIWLPVAGIVWLVWGSTAILATRSWLDWIGANIYAVFLLLAVALAAAVYTYQDRARAQAEFLRQRLQQLQQQYVTAKASVEHISLKATLEERDRLVRSVNDELASALGRLEQLVNRTIAQAQASVVQSHSLLTQTQTTARETVETLRGALATLRPANDLPAPHQPQTITPPPPDGTLVLMSPSIRRLIDWMPLVFGSLVPLWALIEHATTDTIRIETVFIWLGLVGCYIYTQRSNGGPWFQLGLIGQTCSLLVMVALTQSSTLLIGLAMVAGQIALRCSWGQMIAGFVALQGAVGVMIGLINPAPWQVATSLLLFAVTVTALVMPIISARRRFSQRAQANLALLDVTAAVERLNAQAEVLRQHAVVAERHRIAREIHDGLGHYLMTISMQLHIAQERLASDAPGALRQLQETQQLIGEAQRHLIHSFDALNPLPQEPGALRRSLHELVQQHTCQGTMRVTLSIEGNIDDLPDNVNLALYRVAQEGLTNAARHSSATEVQVTLAHWPAQVQLVVANNGRGTTCDTRNGGLGILGMKERAAALGGYCDAGPDLDGGFVLRFELPLTQATTV